MWSGSFIIKLIKKHEHIYILPEINEIRSMPNSLSISAKKKKKSGREPSYVFIISKKIPAAKKTTKSAFFWGVF